MDVHSLKNNNLTRNIVIAMLLGILIGLTIDSIPKTPWLHGYIVNDIFKTLGKIFIILMKMLVVPIVFVSLVAGVSNLGDIKKLGRIGLRTVLLYLFTTCVAITLALFFASVLKIGSGTELTTSTEYQAHQSPSLITTIINMFPENPVKALATGNMLQIIVFSILFGFAMAACGEPGKRINKLFNDIDVILMKLISFIMKIAPWGVFFLISSQFAIVGISLIKQLFSYFMIVIFVLIFHVTFTNTLLLSVLTRLNPLTFFKKMFPAMVFAFSTSSSNVSIPVTLSTVENKLGVHNSVASFNIPLGATINMDGTAIMQGIATVFIANAYNIPLTLIDFITVITTATLASIGTAGVPSVGLITLTMVLQQVGLPVEGIALIIGVDRLLDMLRTSVNITGDAAVSCVIGHYEKAINRKIFNS